MKRIFITISTAFIICLIPFSVVAGQEKKNEQKIKIVVDDGSGAKVIIDTLIKDGIMTDSIVLKDGKVIYIGDYNDETINCTKDGPENMTLTVTSDGNGTKKVVKEITVLSSDSVKCKEAGKHGKMYVYNDIKRHEGRSGTKYRVITSTSNADGEKGERIIYINEGKAPEKEMEKTFDVYVSTDGKDSTLEITRYVIAKDGMVVTVEGNDEAKAKELIKEIENKMGVKSEGTDKKETVKAETKKTVKK